MLGHMTFLALELGKAELEKKKMTERYAAEYQPIWKHVEEIPPPKGAKVLLRTEYGQAIIGQYYPEGKFTHWCGLPRHAPGDKQ